jgi:hypothetical protein
MRQCTWKCTPFPRAFLRRGARGNVRHSHMLFYDAVHVEMYATPTCFSMTQCTWKSTTFLRVDTSAIFVCTFPCYSTCFSMYVQYFLRAFVAVHVEVRHPYVSFLRCQYIMCYPMLQCITLTCLSMLLHVEARHSHTSFLRCQ